MTPLHPAFLAFAGTHRLNQSNRFKGYRLRMRHLW